MRCAAAPTRAALLFLVFLVSAAGACAPTRLDLTLDRKHFAALHGDVSLPGGDTLRIEIHSVYGGVIPYVEARAASPARILDIDADAVLARRLSLIGRHLDPRGVAHEWTLGLTVDRGFLADRTTSARRILALPLREGSVAELQRRPPPDTVLRISRGHAYLAAPSDRTLLDALLPRLEAAVANTRIDAAEARHVLSGARVKDPGFTFESTFAAAPFGLDLAQVLASSAEVIELRERHEPDRVRVAARIVPRKGSSLAALAAAARPLSRDDLSVLPLRSLAAMLVRLDPAHAAALTPRSAGTAAESLRLLRGARALAPAWSGLVACDGALSGANVTCLFGARGTGDARTSGDGESLLRALEPLRLHRLRRRYADREGTQLVRAKVPCVPGGGTCLALRLSWGSRVLVSENARLARRGLLWTEGPLAGLGDFIDTEALGHRGSIAAAPEFIAAAKLLAPAPFALAFRREGTRETRRVYAASFSWRGGALHFDLVAGAPR